MAARSRVGVPKVASTRDSVGCAGPALGAQALDDEASCRRAEVAMAMLRLAVEVFSPLGHTVSTESSARGRLIAWASFLRVICECTAELWPGAPKRGTRRLALGAERRRRAVPHKVNAVARLEPTRRQLSRASHRLRPMPTAQFRYGTEVARRPVSGALLGGRTHSELGFHRSG